MIVKYTDTGFISVIINDMPDPSHMDFYLSEPNTLHSDEQVTHHAHYVLDGKVVDRPTLDVKDPVRIKADGKDAFELKCSAIKIDDEEYEVTGGKLTFVTKDAGTYIFESVFPYQDTRFEVIAK